MGNHQSGYVYGRIMKLAILTCIGLAGASRTEWYSWKRQHGKEYHSMVEEEKRYGVWADNREFVLDHNVRYNSGLETYYVALNKFSDLSSTEMAERYLNSEDAQEKGSGKGFSCGLHYKQNENYNTTCPGCYEVSSTEGMYDWGNAAQNPKGKNLVTTVKDQGSCGSCWAFGGASILESYFCANNYYDCDTWTGISAQNIVDCSLCSNNTNPTVGAYCSNGCGGGWSQNSWYYAYMNGGVDSWDSYPYFSGTTGDEGNCSYTTDSNVFNAGGAIDSHICVWIDHNDELALLDALYRVGPVKVSIDASSSGFHHYSGGIFTDNVCSNTKTSHAVSATGYGTSDGIDFYKIKNSWGETWGMDGYILFRRNYNNMCAVAKYPYYPKFQ